MINLNEEILAKLAGQLEGFELIKIKSINNNFPNLILNSTDTKSFISQIVINTSRVHCELEDTIGLHVHFNFHDGYSYVTSYIQDFDDINNEKIHLVAKSITKIVLDKNSPHAQVTRIKDFMAKPEAKETIRIEHNKIMISVMGKQLSELRKAKNLTPLKLSEIMGVSESVINSIEIGKKDLKVSLIIEYLYAVGGKWSFKL